MSDLREAPGGRVMVSRETKVYLAWNGFALFALSLLHPLTTFDLICWASGTMAAIWLIDHGYT